MELPTLFCKPYSLLKLCCSFGGVGYFSYAHPIISFNFSLTTISFVLFVLFKINVVPLYQQSKGIMPCDFQTNPQNEPGNAPGKENDKERVHRI